MKCHRLFVSEQVFLYVTHYVGNVLNVSGVLRRGLGQGRAVLVPFRPPTICKAPHSLKLWLL